jgi:uncharacterized protein YgiM (DUF1202 family)
MKKMFLLLLILPGLACFSGNVTRGTGKPTASPTTMITNAPVIYLPSATATGIPEAVCVVTVKSLNIRKEPNADVLAWVYAGDVVTILKDARRGEWVKIRAGSVTGWIHSDFCKGQ